MLPTCFPHSPLCSPTQELDGSSEVVTLVCFTFRQHRNLLEAAAAGASQSIALVANIAANLIAFIALLAFVNATIAWFGAFVCLPDLSFEVCLVWRVHLPHWPFPLRYNWFRVFISLPGLSFEVCLVWRVHLPHWPFPVTLSLIHI